MNAKPNSRFSQILALALIVAIGTSTAYSQDGDAILQEVDLYRAPADNFVFDAEVLNSDDKLGLTVHVSDKTKGLVKFSSPKDMEGRAILYVAENMWVYVPGTRRALRISPNQRLLGGASSADISRTVFAHDYTVENSTVDGSSTKLDLVAKTGNTAYAKIVLSVDSQDNKPLSAEYYASGGNRLLKTMYFEGYEEVLGKQRPMKTRIIDHVDGDSETVMLYSNMRVEDTPEAWFQPSYLGRL